jgi:ribosomal protein L37AE/L43A
MSLKIYQAPERLSMMAPDRPPLFKKIRHIGQVTAHHAYANSHRCPECHGAARLNNGNWCDECDRTGIAGGRLPSR